MTEQHVFDFIDANTSSMINNISELVSIPSVRGEICHEAPFGSAPKEALEKALDICRGYGFNIKNIQNAIGYADMNNKELGLGILAHADVVPTGDGWESDPFKMNIKDGMLIGRGVSDDKGPMMAALMAMWAVKSCGIELTKNVRLIIGSDEESGSGDLKYYFDNEDMPPYSFSPDAEFPIINTEKGRFAPHFYADCTNESNTEARITYFSSGAAVNAVPNTAVLKIAGCDIAWADNICNEVGERLNIDFTVEALGDGVKITAKGVAAHASTPEMGNNALTASLELIRCIDLPKSDVTEAFAGLGILFPHGDFYGKGLGVAMEDDISGRLTVSLDVLTYDGKRLEGYFDSRMPVSANDDNFIYPTAAKLRGVGFNMDNLGYTPVHHVDKDLPFVCTLLNAYEKHTGMKGECIAIGGGTYVHDIKNGVAFGAIMPDCDTHMHGANECMPIVDLVIAAKIYASVIMDICK